jgi:hypothetical protein
MKIRYLAIFDHDLTARLGLAVTVAAWKPGADYLGRWIAVPTASVNRANFVKADDRIICT